MSEKLLPRTPKRPFGFFHGAADPCQSAELRHQPQKCPLLLAENHVGCLDFQGDELGDVLAHQFGGDLKRAQARRMRCWISCSLIEEAMPPLAGPRTRPRVGHPVGQRPWCK